MRGLREGVIQRGGGVVGVTVGGGMGVVCGCAEGSGVVVISG